MKKVLKLIKEIEKKNKIKVLFAVESGSREWGFASEDSDYDIRAVHHSPLNKYLSLNEPKKQLDLIKGNLDFVSWDIKKFASLLLKSNPTVSEWLDSKTIYINSNYRKKLKSLFQKGFSSFALKKHYVSLARQNYEKYIRNKKQVNLKKYLYILRAIACVNFLEKRNKTPPLNYKKVLPFLPKKIAEFMNSIVEKKKKSEHTKGKANIRANKYIESFFNKNFKNSENNINQKKINNLVIKIIKEI